MGYNWVFDKDRFPDQRSNWKKMPSNNKRYAIDQYNIARQKRNLPPIPNPFRRGGNPYVIKPDSPLARKFPSWVGVETVTKPSAKTINITPIPKKNPVISLIESKNATSTTPSPFGQISDDPKDFSDEELSTLFQTPSFVKELEKMNDLSSIPDQTPGPSGVARPTTTTPRTSTAEGEPPAKKPLIASTPKKGHEDMAKHPGTGRSSDMDLGDPLNETMRSTAGSVNVGAGHGTSGGLAMEKGDFIPDVPRPYNFRMQDGFGHVKNAFSMLSYGFASKILPHPGNLTPQTTKTNAFVVVATTPLIEVPWDRVSMYLNKGIYDSLPTGSYVHSVHCKVIQRNIRVAFETAASTTSLATLNQNKFTLTAVGLNNKNDIRVSNMRYKVEGQDTSMVPISVEDPVYTDIDKCLYGYGQLESEFNGTTVSADNPSAIPCVNFSFNSVIHPRNYLVAWNTGYKTTENTEQVKNMGWYNLSEHVRKCPTGKVIDGVIVNESYYPTYAPLKGQLDFCEYLRDNVGISPPSGDK